MNTHPSQDPNFSTEADASMADLLPYIKAGKHRFPSKEELFAEVNRDRDSRKKVANTLQYTVAFMVCALGVWAINPTISSNTYTTNYAENKRFDLSDGSSVHLNANTTLLTSFRLHSREMRLEKGEASFTVKHGWRPFTVAVNHSEVLDIGTVFNISKWDQSSVTSVLEGEVEVHNAGKANRLISGQSMAISDSGLGVPYQANMEMVTAWQTGKIIFNQTPLKEAIASIQRYRKAPIQLDPRVEHMRITGIYDVNKIESLLDSMDAMFPVKVTRLDAGEINIQKNNP